MTHNNKADASSLPVAATWASAQDGAPRSEREHELCCVFEETLGVGQVRIHDNFFDLGGHSLLALQLVARARGELGLAITVRDLFAAPTVAGLLGSGRDEHRGLEVLLPIRAVGGGLPLFVIHPALGLSWCYSAMTRFLESGYPIYGLQADGILQPRISRASLEQMATGYVQEIRRVQPDGPYRLLGWSFGGNLAHAMAVIFRDHGEVVSFLAMLDSYAPQVDARGTGDYPPAEAEDIPSLERALSVTPGALAAIPSGVLSALDGIFAHNLRAAARHHTGFFDGNASVFAAAHSLLGGGDPQSWRRHVGGALAVRTISGDHYDMVGNRALREICSVINRQLA